MINPIQKAHPYKHVIDFESCLDQFKTDQRQLMIRGNFENMREELICWPTGVIHLDYRYLTKITEIDKQREMIKRYCDGMEKWFSGKKKHYGMLLMAAQSLQSLAKVQIEK